VIPVDSAPQATDPAPQAEGVRSAPSPFPFAETLGRLTRTVEQRGLTLFATVDHAAGARGVGLKLNDATLLVFGNPRGGTPVMAAAPLAALELPLRALVWTDDAGAVWVGYQDIAALGRRFGVPAGLLAPLAAVEELVAAALTP
jgi:uncharacterized protein (DUF302 family)